MVQLQKNSSLCLVVIAVFKSRSELFLLGMLDVVSFLQTNEAEVSPFNLEFFNSFFLSRIKCSM